MSLKSTKGEFLEAHKLDEKINKLNETFLELKNRAYSASTKSLGIKVKTTAKTDMLEQNAIKMLEIEEKIQNNSKKLLEIEEKIQNLAEKLDCPIQKAIIIWRYICRYKWSDIAKKSQISEPQLIREHRKAIEKITS